MKEVKGLSFGLFYDALSGKDPFDFLLHGVELNHEKDVLCYLQYLSARHLLVARAGTGLASFENLGINLSEDKSFDFDSLKNPQKFSLLREFVEGALERKNFLASAVEVAGEPTGLLVLAAERSLSEKDFNSDWVKALELISAQRYLSRRLEKFDQYCPDTEVLTPAGLHTHLYREVVRARRVRLPVSTIIFAIDHYEQMMQKLNGIQRKNWIVALAKLLQGHSRVNDWIGRLDHGMFAVILPHTSLKGARSKAYRIMSLVAEATLKVGGQSLKFTLSSVVNEYPSLSEDSEELLTKGYQVLRQNNKPSSLLEAGARANFVADFKVES